MLSEKEQKKKEFIRNGLGASYIGASLSQVGLPVGSEERVLVWVNNPKNFMVYTGPAGTGKTYFCAECADRVYEKYRSIRGYNEAKIFLKSEKVFQVTTKETISNTLSNY